MFPFWRSFLQKASDFTGRKRVTCKLKLELLSRILTQNVKFYCYCKVCYSHNGVAIVNPSLANSILLNAFIPKASSLPFWLLPSSPTSYFSGLLCGLSFQSQLLSAHFCD